MNKGVHLHSFFFLRKIVLLQIDGRWPMAEDGWPSTRSNMVAILMSENRFQQATATATANGRPPTANGHPQTAILHRQSSPNTSTMNQYSHYFEVNKQAWNVRTAIHKDSSFYDLEGFKQGLSSLKQIELLEVGSVKNKTLLHLQCHFGMDTISWARLGAKATGLDFAEDAIALAKELNEELGCNAEFICANVYDLQPQLRSGFDIVYTSYGVIGWLPDLDEWAAVISKYVKPGGTFYMVEFHPVLWMMDDNFSYIKYNYFNTSVIEEEIAGTYADRNAPVKLSEYGWNHPFSEIINALLTHGFRLDFLHEFPYSPFNCFNNVEQGNDGNWRIKNMGEKIPMVYSIKATKEL